MLSLPKQVYGADFSVDAVVGDDKRLCRSCHQIDSDTPVELTFGLSNQRIAGPDEHVDAVDELSPKRKRRDRLHAAQHVNLVGASQGHRRNGLCRQHPIDGRSAGGHAPHPRDFRGEHTHVRRRNHRITTAGHVSTDRADGNQFVAERHSGKGLDFHRLKRRKLGLRESPNLGLRKFDIGDGRLVDA